jgi:hypothetical protein
MFPGRGTNFVILTGCGRCDERCELGGFLFKLSMKDPYIFSAGPYISAISKPIIPFW